MIEVDIAKHLNRGPIESLRASQIFCSDTRRDHLRERQNIIYFRRNVKGVVVEPSLWFTKKIRTRILHNRRSVIICCGVDLPSSVSEESVQCGYIVYCR